MIKPMCRFCNTRHHFREAHVFEGAKPDMANTKKSLANMANDVANSMANGSKPTKNMANIKKDMVNKKGGDASDRNIRSDHVLRADVNVGGSASDLKTRTYQYRSTEKRKAYMKEYMKKKRMAERKKHDKEGE